MNNCITTETHFSQTIQFDDIKKVKIELLQIINAIIKRNSWSQIEAARVLGIDQPKVSKMKHLYSAGFSLGRLFRFLLRLNCDMNLVINISEDITVC